MEAQILSLRKYKKNLILILITVSIVLVLFFALFCNYATKHQQSNAQVEGKQNEIAELELETSKLKLDNEL